MRVVTYVEFFLHGELHLGAVNADDGDGHLFANLAEVFNLHVEVVGELGDVHQTFDTLRDLDEGAKRLNGHDFAFNLFALLQTLDSLSLRILLLLVLFASQELSLLLRLLGGEFFLGRRLLHRQRDLLVLDFLDPNLNILVFRDDVGDVFDETSLELRNVHETVLLCAEVDEAAVVLNALHLTGEFSTDDDVLILDGDVLAREASARLLRFFALRRLRRLGNRGDDARAARDDGAVLGSVRIEYSFVSHSSFQRGHTSKLANEQANNR